MKKISPIGLVVMALLLGFALGWYYTAEFPDGIRFSQHDVQGEYLGEQIKTPDELKPGMLINRHYGHGKSGLLIVSDVYYDPEGNCLYDAVYADTLAGWPVTYIIHTEFCSDSGLVPYSSGAWSNVALTTSPFADPWTTDQLAWLTPLLVMSE